MRAAPACLFAIALLGCERVEPTAPPDAPSPPAAATDPVGDTIAFLRSAAVLHEDARHACDRTAPCRSDQACLSAAVPPCEAAAQRLASAGPAPAAIAAWWDAVVAQDVSALLASATAKRDLPADQVDARLDSIADQLDAARKQVRALNRWLLSSGVCLPELPRCDYDDVMRGDRLALKYRR